uniref:Uncharacterized protein n=1 Tax=Parastrongyloides trichosuri TaxID=131310 RepID=A0A0N4ZP87_PARTI
MDSKFDPTSYWKDSLEITESNKNETIREKFKSSRSNVWSTISMLPPSQQANYISKLINYWPVATERNAFNMPHFGTVGVSALTASIVATKINSDFFLFSNKVGYFESIRRAPKSPYVMSIYVSGITNYFLNQTYIYKPLLQEGEINNTTIISRCILNGIISGVLMPMVTVPLLAHYVMLQRTDIKAPQIKNFIDLAALSMEGIKVCKRIIPLFITGHIITGTLAAYSILYGRDKIFNTMDIDEDFIKEAINSANNHVSLKEKVINLLQKLPFNS